MVWEWQVFASIFCASLALDIIETSLPSFAFLPSFTFHAGASPCTCAADEALSASLNQPCIHWWTGNGIDGNWIERSKLNANSCSQRFLDTSCFDQKQRPRGRPETKNNTRENATKSWRVYITVFHKNVLKPSMQARKQNLSKIN